MHDSTRRQGKGTSRQCKGHRGGTDFYVWVPDIDRHAFLSFQVCCAQLRRSVVPCRNLGRRYHAHAFDPAAQACILFLWTPTHMHAAPHKGSDPVVTKECTGQSGLTGACKHSPSVISVRPDALHALSCREQRKRSPYLDVRMHGVTASACFGG